LLEELVWRKLVLFGGGESTRTKGGDNRSVVEEWVDGGAAVV
jgi:hypothetical protein